MNGIEHLLDTNVLIGLLKGHEPAQRLASEAGLSLRRAGISQISRIELLGFPALSQQEEQQCLALLDLCQMVHITDAVETKAIALRRTGKLKLPDAIVAASALATGARLLTLDERLVRAMAEQAGQS
ncbi:MAG: type II toxin-antitoxin system VapC family toxin [Burkholderiaceae bacterium]|nr:type II toxin-antitoxin system VapC family toxin [Burkholderiaceae bacterium]